MRVGVKSAAVWTLPLAVVIVALATIAADPGGIATRIRGIQFDSYQYLHKRAYTDPKARSGYSVRVLDFDDAAMARFGAWPFGHARLAKLVSELKTAGASVVVLDAALDAPDPLSPQAFAKDLPPGPENDLARRTLDALPSPDMSFAKALAAINSVTGFSLSDKAGGRLPEKKPVIAFQGAESARAKIPGFDRATAPILAVEQASVGAGARNLAYDPDGKLRAMPLLFRLNGKLVPSLDAVVMRLLGGGDPLTVITRERGIPNINMHETVARVRSGKLSVPVRSDGAMEIYFTGPEPARNISALALDEGKIAEGSLAQTIVYIAPPGAVAATPLGPESIGQIHAEAMENILLGTPLVPANTLYGELVFVLIAGVAIAFLIARVGLLWAGIFTAAAIAAAQTFTWMLFVDSRTLFDSLNPSFALAAAFFSGFAARAIEIAKTRTSLRQAFDGVLPEADFDRIATSPALLKSEGETRTVTCLACGIRGFAALAESFVDDPIGFTRLTGTIMKPLIDTAIERGAMVDCVTGEGFLAYWNAPLEDTEHAMHACETANRMTIVLAEVNEQLSRERRFDGTAFQPIEIGIGISTGPAVTGGFGDRGRLNYFVSGDCTSMAGRIRAQSGQYGPAIIVSDDTRKAAERGFAFLEVDFLACGPRGEPVKLYAMLGNPLVRASPKFRALATFHEHIFQSLRTQQWDKTRDLIDQCRKLSGASQKLYDLHLARIAWYEQSPPGEDWDGAFRPAVK